MLIDNPSNCDHCVMCVCTMYVCKRVYFIMYQAPWQIPASQPGPEWPQAGAVEFHSYGTGYRDNLELVLKDLTFHVRPKEKVMGRSGERTLKF